MGGAADASAIKSFAEKPLMLGGGGGRPDGVDLIPLVVRAGGGGGGRPECPGGAPVQKSILFLSNGM